MAPAAFWRAWSVWAVSVAVTATTVGYTVLHPLPAKLASQFGSAPDGSLAFVFVAAFATVGALLAWKRPGNPIGWLLSATGLAYAVGIFQRVAGALSPDADPGHLAGLDLSAGHRAVRVRRAAVSTGHLPSRRWRPVAWAAGAGLAGWALGSTFAPAVAVQPVDPGTRRACRPGQETSRSWGSPASC